MGLKPYNAAEDRLHREIRQIRRDTRTEYLDAPLSRREVSESSFARGCIWAGVSSVAFVSLMMSHEVKVGLAALVVGAMGFAVELIHCLLVRTHIWNVP